MKSIEELLGKRPMRREPLIPPHYTPDHPDPSTRQLSEEPFTEQLKEIWHEPDPRPIATRTRAKVLEPNLNKLYGSGRSEGDWRYFVDNYATGTLTTVISTTVKTAIVLANPPNARLLQWPFAVQAYLVIRKFSLACQSAITTVGAIDVQFNDWAGNIIPLGDFVSSGNINEDIDTIIPTPITDPGFTAIGNLLVLLSGTSSTTSVCNYQLGFSYAYLLPSLEGYEAESIHRVLGRKDQDR